MKITADTNVLVRAITEDHKRQSPAAQALLAEAEAVALTIPVLCELVWVLSRSYGFSMRDIGGAIRQLIDSANVLIDRTAAEAGLAVLEAGGDFADGVIAREGRWLGAEVFVSFDKKAVKLVESTGSAARLLSF